MVEYIGLCKVIGRGYPIQSTLEIVNPKGFASVHFLRIARVYGLQKSPFFLSLKVIVTPDPARAIMQRAKKKLSVECWPLLSQQHFWFIDIKHVDFFLKRSKWVIFNKVKSKQTPLTHWNKWHASMWRHSTIPKPINASMLVEAKAWRFVLCNNLGVAAQVKGRAFQITVLIFSSWKSLSDSETTFFTLV